MTTVNSTQNVEQKKTQYEKSKAYQQKTGAYLERSPEKDKFVKSKKEPQMNKLAVRAPQRLPKNVAKKTHQWIMDLQKTRETED